MQFLDTQFDSPDDIRRVLRRANPVCDRETEERVREIIRAVGERGDDALREFTRRFDRVERADLRVNAAEFAAAAESVGPGLREAVALASANILRFHQHRVPEGWVHEADGAMLGQLIRPIAAVGIHVPAGRAPLPSTLLMAAIPAQVAGVPRIVVCTPPQSGGSVDALTLYVAQTLGIDEVYAVGGAQAVAAMALGTDSIQPVDKIVGPGNVYTITAKRLLFGQVGIESLPGPTEVLVIADDSATAAWVAADLLSQAEHDENSLAVLLTPCRELGRAVAGEVELQMSSLTNGTAAACIAAHGYIIYTRDLEEACALASYAAAEHVELAVRAPREWLPQITNAGAVMLGHHTPEPIGDYIAGPSHILPTGATARFSSPLHVDDFLHKTSILEYTPERFEREAEPAALLAESETLQAHAASLRIRRKGNL